MGSPKEFTDVEQTEEDEEDAEANRGFIDKKPKTARKQKTKEKEERERALMKKYNIKAHL